MDATTLETIKKNLTDEKDVLLKTILQEEDIRVNDIESNEGPKDSVDLANDDVEKILQDKLSIQQTQRLNQIESALVRIGNGTYGKCLNCGNLIAPVRLEVQPFAAYCRDCQEKMEKKPIA